MATYKNESKGARTIHLITGGYVLVEAGAEYQIGEHKVKRLAPDIVVTETDRLPKVPAKAVKAVAGAKKAGGNPELTKARAAYKAKFGKQPSPRWDVAAIREKIAAA